MKHYHKNPRQITKKQRSDLSRWLRELGDLSGVVHDLNTGEIIGGNMRGDVFNINECEITYTVQYDEPDYQGTVALGYVVWQDALYNYREVRWTARQCEQANIVANKAGGSFDFDVLANEFEQVDLLEWGFEPFELGIEPSEPESQDAEPQTNRADELREEWGVELGQMWRLPSRTEGQEHRLICGDCTDGAVVERVMGGDRAVGCFTSPPYAEQRAFVYESISSNDYNEWWEVVQSTVRMYLFSDCNFFVNIKPHSEDYQRSLYVMDLIISMARDWGWLYIDEFCWLRSGIPGDPKKMGKFKNQFEPIHHFALGKYPFIPDNVTHESDGVILDDNYDPGFGRNYQGKGMNRFGKREIGKGLAYPGNVIKAVGNEAFGHEAAFPVSLPEFFIKAYSGEGDIWIEPFSGSGTTIIAAENLSRQCRAVEISPAYVAVALQRYFDAFGIRAELID